MNKILITIFIAFALFSSGCSKGLFSVHKLDIQQGNALNEEDIGQLKEGMTRMEVQELLGTPVIEPLFQNTRWDYLYYLKEPDEKPVRRVISVYFDGDNVVRVE